MKAEKIRKDFAYKGRKLGRAAIVAVLLSSSAFVPLSYANPEGGQVVGGSATISETGKKLDVHQHTDRAVIDWRSFNIDVDEHTQFHQPSSSATALNRVKSADPSQILGKLSANGNVILVNPNGVFFGKDSVVDVNGLVATTADMDTSAFMSGSNHLNIPGRPDAAIINEGTITARDAGLVGLVAPNVENHGIIQARMGRVHLASGDTVVADFYGDGLLKVEITDESVKSQFVGNTGRLGAEGGTVAMTAAAARQTVNSLIVAKGELKAPTISKQGGKIIIQDKNTTGQVLVSAKLDASGIQEEGTGGDVEILGQHVGLMAGAHIDASGVNGGGQVLIGGDYQGQGDVQTARMTYVDEEALIDVQAHEDGNGGRAIIWAEDITRFYGRIHADGGSQSGDGGFVEVSGKEFLDFNGAVTTLAEHGEAGTLLLDPTDITISNAVNSNVNGATPFSPNIDDGPSNLNVTTLQAALAGANVIVQTRATGSQLGDITVVNPISWSANRSLTLDAHNKIYINAPITARNALIFTANDVDINANLIEHASGANLTIQPKTAATTIGVAGGAGTLNLSTADLNFIQPGWNNIIIGATNGTGIMDVGARSWNAPLTLRSSTGEIQINGAQTMGNRALALTTRNLSINANLSGTRTLTIDPGANVTVGVAGEPGTLNLTMVELDRIQNGFSGITIGRAANTQTQRVGAYTWNDPLTLRTGTGQLNIVGTPTMGANNLTLATRNLALSVDLAGTGTITIHPGGNYTVGVAGEAGALQITNSILDRIIDGWGLISQGLSSNTQAMNIGARTWTDSAQFVNGTGLITVSDAQDMGGNNLTITSRSDIDINAPLTGGNILTLRPVLDTVSTGVAGGAGTFNLSVDDLNNIADGWTRIDIGLTTNDQPINVNAYTWNDSVRFLNDSGIIAINGAQNMGS
ncbi:MAG: filamentous hemagglutinin N-terminal domain-containing protein, partial [Alphaproteobacteria bacterium]|nr:filamentous hemagglutinin N-terminal domain-containing protein [Alphaproteobacteria bacterium]